MGKFRETWSIQDGKHKLVRVVADSYHGSRLGPVAFMQNTQSIQYVINLQNIGLDKRGIILA